MTTEQTTQTVGPIEDNRLYRIFFSEACNLQKMTREEKVAAAAEVLAVDANHALDGQERIMELMLFSQYLHTHRQYLAQEIILTTQSAVLNKENVDLLVSTNRGLRNINQALQNACDTAIRTTNDAFNFIRLDKLIKPDGRTGAVQHIMEIKAVDDHFNDLRRCSKNLGEEFNSLVDQGECLAGTTPKPAKTFARQSARPPRPAA